MQNFPRKFFAILNTSLSFIFILHTKNIVAKLIIRKKVLQTTFLHFICPFVRLFLVYFFFASLVTQIIYRRMKGRKENRELESGSKQSFRNSKVLTQHLN
jgi:hypothetical protein